MAGSEIGSQAPAWLVGYLRWVLRRRGLVLVGLLAVSGVAVFSVSRAVLSTAVVRLFFGDNPKYDLHQALVKRFANDEIIAVVIDDPALSSPARLRQLDRATRAIERMKWVKRAASITNLQRIADEDGALTVRRYFERAVESSAAAQRAMREMRADPFTGGAFVSADGRKTAVLVEPFFNPDRPVESWGPLLERLKDAFARQGFRREGLHLAGGPIHLVAMLRSSRSNLAILFPASCVVVTVLVLLLFRALWPIWVTMATALIAVLWTMGLAVAVDQKISVLVSMVPIVMLVVAVSDNIHICSAYLLELGAGRDKEEAILQAGGEVGLACLYTSLTTMIGFASLAFIPAPVIRHLAIILAFGVSIALLISITLTPILLSWMRPPRPPRASRFTLPALVDRLALWTRALSSGRPISVLIVSALLISLAVWGALRINVETDLSRRFPPDAPLSVAERLVKEHLCGTNYVDLYVSSDERGGVLTPAVFAAVSRLQAEMTRRPEADASLSLVDMVRKMHREVVPAAQRRHELPRSREAIAQYVLLFEGSGGSHLDRMVDFERRTLHVSFRLNDYGVRKTAAFAERARRRALELLPAGMTVQLSGLAYLMGDWLDRVLAGQRLGLIFAFFIISALMTFALKSIRAGLLSMIPNVFPLLFLGAYLGWFLPSVDSDTMMIAIVAIGIAVDDTIHFLTRLRLERRRGAEVPEAIERTFRFSGRAIIMTTLILGVGFLPMGWSDYLTVRLLGTLLPLTLVFAVVADLILLPAMAKLQLLRFRGGASSR